MTGIDEIIEKAKDHEIITFDVFDTLLIRDVKVPTDIFRIAYGTAGRYVRVMAEIAARSFSKDGEVTLKDIDKLCPFSCTKEIETEKQYCRANPAMLDVYKNLIQSGKKVYALSDMYLSSGVISDLLASAGYDLPVMVSCEERCSKRTGELYKKFLSEYGYQPDQVLHIGDDTAADCLGAQKAGITCCLIPRHENALSYTGYNWKDHELISFINHGLNEIDDPVEKIGYEIVGPMILSFCQWIHEKKSEYGFERLYFLARDMRFSYEIYKSLYKDDARYLCVSRKSLEYAESHPDEMCEYLKTESCCGNISIVDTGWVGGAQTEIEKYSRMIDDATDLGGLYLGAKPAFGKLKRSKRSAVYLAPLKKDRHDFQIMPGFVETLIGCNEKQVISYEDGRPVFDRETDRDHTDIIKNGAKRFIDEWVEITGNKPINVISAKRALKEMFLHPSDEHIELLGHLHYEDYTDTDILTVHKKQEYFSNPKLFFSDLSDSVWKGAFFKRTFLLYRFWLGLYCVLGSLRLYSVDLKKIKA